MNKNKVEKKEFLGMEVRVVNNEWLVLKDMFDALGRVKADGGWNNEKNKLKEFLSLIGKEEDSQTLGVLVKQGKIKTTQTIECLKLDTVPIVLTQFKPTKAKGEEALNKWCDFMKFINDILTDLEVYRFIITDKEKQKSNTEILVDCGGSAMIANNQANIIMAKLIGVYNQGIKQIKKEELKKYQPQTTVDLLTVRDFVYTKFVNAYEFTGSHKDSADMVLKLAKKKYNI